MANSTHDGIQYDPSGLFAPQTVLNPEELQQLSERMLICGQEALDDTALWKAGGPVPEQKRPLDAAFVDLPTRLLEAYSKDGRESELARILATARRLTDEVDRVIVLGIGGSYMGSRAVFDACCHPYHNELSRSERGGRPCLYFAGNNADNDQTRGLFDLLATPIREGGDRRWAVVVISKSGGTLETAVALRQFLSRLRADCGPDAERVAKRVIPVTGRQGRLRRLATELGCPEVFDIPEGLGGRWSIFSAVGLLPAAIVGLDVVALLEGAAGMTTRFRVAPWGENPPLEYTAACHLAETKAGAAIRVLATWGDRLETVGLWYDQLLAESLGKEGMGATPLTTVNTRDLHSRQQQHQQGQPNKLYTNILVTHPRCDPLRIEREQIDEDELNLVAGTSLPEILKAAMEATNASLAEAGRPTATIHLPQLDERRLGELLQMLMLATFVEGRLLGINPFGQPGVERYKELMREKLQKP